MTTETTWNGTPYTYLHPAFEGFNVPQWFLDNAEDNSWANDACPSFHYANPVRGPFRVFVDAEDVNLSESGARADGSYPRYSVFEDDAYAEELGDLLFETASLDVVILFLTREDSTFNPAP